WMEREQGGATRVEHERAEKACRCGWCIAEVGQNPLNYNFLAALRRPSLKRCHKPRWAQRRSPPATCLGFARFRPLFVRFLPIFNLRGLGFRCGPVRAAAEPLPLAAGAR